MLLRRRSSWEVSENEVTPRGVYEKRRKFLRAMAGSAALGGLAVSPLGGMLFSGMLSAKELARGQGVLPALDVSGRTYNVDEEMTPYDSVTSYNNFYEFGGGKEDPRANAHTLKPRPWQVHIDGEVTRPLTLDIEDILKQHTLEERVYRFRCVEAWSMVIPWVGFTLADLLAKAEPTAAAKYVRFETLNDPEQMPQANRASIPYPYVEGLRMDEAMHPLTLMAVGLYGEVLPNQNGAPLRLVVPWKYGFKSIKSIVRISFTKEAPLNTWQALQPSEYGFYANVNPTVDHPRWSQARERRIGEFFRRETLMFNGYEAEVADLYKGMDLSRWY